MKSLLRMNVVETWFIAVWGLCWCNCCLLLFVAVCYMFLCRWTIFDIWTASTFSRFRSQSSTAVRLEMPKSRPRTSCRTGRWKSGGIFLLQMIGMLWVFSHNYQTQRVGQFVFFAGHQGPWAESAGVVIGWFRLWRAAESEDRTWAAWAVLDGCASGLDPSSPPSSTHPEVILVVSTCGLGEFPANSKQTWLKLQSQDSGGGDKPDAQVGYLDRDLLHSENLRICLWAGLLEPSLQSSAWEIPLTATWTLRYLICEK